MMKRFAILGHPVAHSLSPKFHNAVFKKMGLANYVYEFCDTPPSKLKHVLEDMRAGKWQGFSVTIPYKEAVIPYLDEFSPIARRVGAVNTIVRRSNGTLFGDNTDYIGVKKAMEEKGFLDSPAFRHGECGVARNDKTNKTALTLGTGGASKAVIAVLLDHGWKVTVGSRKKGNEKFKTQNVKLRIQNYSELDPNNKYYLIINTTPVGMEPDTDRSLLTNPEWFRPDRLYMDVIYTPKMTKFLKLAKKAGAKIITGDRMFYFQAMEQSKIFTN